MTNSLQEGFIYHSLVQGDTDDAYCVQLIWDYHNQLDIEKLKTSWYYAQSNYPSLRLRFSWDSELVQIIDREVVLDWRFIDATNIELDQRESFLTSLTKEDRLEGYDLSMGQLFRVYLLKWEDSNYCSLFSCHHAILDGWSNPILLGYVHKIYLDLIYGREISISRDISYLKTQEYLQLHNLHNQGYWSDYLSKFEGFVEDLSSLLKEDRKHIILSDYRHIKNFKSQELELTLTQYDNLKLFCSKYGVTVNAVLQYLWHKQLSIHSSNPITVVGMTVSGRNLPVENIEESVGLYINTLPVLLMHTDGLVLDNINQLQSYIQGANSHSDICLSKLQSEGNRLFNSLFVYENYPVSIDGTLTDELTIEFKKGIEKSDYPLGITAHEQNGTVRFKLNYAGELFEDDKIVNLLDGISCTLKQLLANPAIVAKDMSYINISAYNQIVYDWNATSKDYPREKCIHTLFEEQVARTPFAIAVVYEDNRLTYRELNEKANQLAHYLLDIYNIKPDDLIGLCLDRSENMLIAILAVLKSGGAYVPMDPSYPDDRITYITKDTNTKVVLTNAIYQDRLADILLESNPGLLSVDQHDAQIDSCPISNPPKHHNRWQFSLYYLH